MKLLNTFPVAIALLVVVVQFTAVRAIPHRLLKRKTTFSECDPYQVLPPLLSVTVNPDPITAKQYESFTYSGPVGSDITEEDTIEVMYVPRTGGYATVQCSQPVCVGSDCPIKAGTSFIKNIVCASPVDVPDDFSVAVILGNSDKPIACALVYIRSGSAS